MSQTKITVKIYEPMLIALDKQLKGLFIKQDTFLNTMIQKGIPYLAYDMQKKWLAPTVNRYIASELKRMGTKTVNPSIFSLFFIRATSTHPYPPP